ncbi:hypothetical protein AC070_05755 [Fannyhessea vaginae]|uniref:amidohydrolase family protein n=1 Tax=Fannyhessea vaginae TaxID=82135 RepID=UPI00065E52E0|nr:amidohydrolase family protein [Fannyhessea vaginae]KMT47303.1 hypothetical protein AC070_05755 [Fannyhessea vaginae]
MIDIHSHILYANGHYDIKSVLADMDHNGIKKRVVSSLNGLSIKENNHNISNIVGKFKDRLIGCAVINPKSVDSISDTEDACSLPYIRMIEFNPVFHGYYPDSESNLHEIFNIINKVKLPVKIFTGIGAYGIPQQWEKYLEAYPDIKFIFLHMGCFDYGYTCIDVVNRHSNAYVEISNQYELQILRKCLASVNTKHILFGTSFPERLTTSSLLAFDLMQITDETKECIYKTNNYEFLKGI